MNTPKSQNPEGKVVAWLSPDDDGKGNGLGMLMHDTPQTTALRAYFESKGVRFIPLIPATTHADMQRRLEALQRWEPDYEEFGMAMIGDRDGDYVKWSDIQTLLRDGKGDGVSTAEGEG